MMILDRGLLFWATLYIRFISTNDSTEKWETNL